MIKMKRKLMFVLITILIVPLCQAQNWPGWRGENRDGKVAGFQTPEKWPASLAKVWQVNVGLGDASVSLVDGKFFLHVKQDENEVALCLDAANGNQIWKTVLNPAPEVTGGASTHPGPRTTPTVANGKVYVIGAGGFINCLDANSGAVIWKNESFTEVPEFFAAMSPLIVDGLCLAHLNGRANGKVVAFNASNGQIIWSLDNTPSTYSSPVLMKNGSDEFIVLQAESELIGISKTGIVLWRIPTPGEQRSYNSTTPIIDGQNVIICGQGVGMKSFKIEKTANGYSTSQNWHNPDFGGSFNTPVLNNGFIYGSEARLGKLYCINAQTGATAWSDDKSLNRFTATLNLGKYILALPATGNMIVYEANPAKFTEVVTYDVADTEVYSHPVLAGDKIYVKDAEMFTCWSVK
jgi:outer membrane protein assembly factor BamB